MKKNPITFLKISLQNLIEAILNLLVFFPYFFSVLPLLKTLFAPWKNLVHKKTSPGFSFSEWLDRIFFNVISRTMGFSMRSSIIIFYFLLQTVFTLAIPLIVLVYIALLPFLYLLEFLHNETQIKEKVRKNFISQHMLFPKNEAAVNHWFENIYLQGEKRKKWWKISHFFSIPPLARDWAMGFTPTLDEYIEDLSSALYQSRIKNVVDRQNEISEIEKILSKTDEANVILLGAPGVGKNTIVDAFAKKIYEGNSVSYLAYKRVVRLNMAKILSTSTDQSQREKILEDLFAEAAEAKNIIIVIPDIQKHISSKDVGTDLTSPIEKYGKTAKVQFITITTPDLYEKIVFPNESIRRIFTKIDVYEISKQEALQLLTEITPFYEKRHSVIIPYETLTNIIEKSGSYMTSIPFPEKAVELLDLACIESKKTKDEITVKPDSVDQVLTQITHIPTTLTSGIKEKLVNLETLLSNSIIQQNAAISELATALRRSFLLMGNRTKPIATMLFLGPTGVGKTQTAKTIAGVFFGSEKFLNRFDMSLYQSKSDIEKLFGGADESSEPGLLTKTIREKPYGVLLLDEIEKANPDLLNTFLTILDEGYFTDGKGTRVNCKNLVIIATSNAASAEIYKDPNIDINSYLIENHIFSPEFLNRFDGVVVFQPLSEESANILAKKMIKSIVAEIYQEYGVSVEVNEAYLSNLTKNSYDPRFGARNMERTIRHEVEDKVVAKIFKNEVKKGDSVKITGL